MELINGDIVLKQLTLEDSDLLFQLTDRNRTFIRTWLPWVDGTRTVNDTKHFIESIIDNKNALHFGIWYQKGLVGVIGFHRIDTQNRRATIGYWLDEERQGKGVMTTACTMLINYGFEELELNRVEISCGVGNKKSCAIPERLGFKEEGIRRDAEWVNDHFTDHKLYGLLKKDWRASI